MSEQPAIVVEGLAKSYGKVEALAGIDLGVLPATVFGLLGPNGAGKTTAVRILTTLLRPDAGRATVAFQKEEVEELFRGYLREMKPGAGARIKETAEHLSFVLEGAMARAGLDGHDGRLKAARRIAVSIVDSL